MMDTVKHRKSFIRIFKSWVILFTINGVYRHEKVTKKEEFDTAMLCVAVRLKIDSLRKKIIFL